MNKALKVITFIFCWIFLVQMHGGSQELGNGQESWGGEGGFRRAEDPPVGGKERRSGLATAFADVLRGGVISAGVSLRGVGAGTIEVTGIPEGSKINTAYLYWSAVTDSGDMTSSMGTLGGNQVSGQLIGTSPSPCWSPPNHWTFRADVVDLVADQDFTYSVSFTDSGDPDTAPSIEGASLVVVYENPAEPLTQVEIRDGSSVLVQFPEALGTSFSLDEEFVSGEARLTFIVSDGQSPAGDMALFNDGTMDHDLASGDDAFQSFWENREFEISDLIAAEMPFSNALVETRVNQGFHDCIVWIAAIMEAELPTDVPVQGGVRVAARIDSILADPPPIVTVDGIECTDCDLQVYDDNGKSVAYFTPPPHSEGAVEATIANGMTEAHRLELQYTPDTLRSVNAIQDGLIIHFHELTTHNTGVQAFESSGPKGGAVAEVVLHGVLHAYVPAGDRDDVRDALEGLLPAVRDFLDERLFDAARILPITDGQTGHAKYVGRANTDLILMTMGTGTLTLQRTSPSPEDGPDISGGRFVFPYDFVLSDGTYYYENVENVNWRFRLEIDPSDRPGRALGLQVADIYGKDTGAPTSGFQYVSPRLSLPQVRVVVDGVPVSFGLRKEHLSHVYIHENVIAQIPEPKPKDPDHTHEQPEWIAAAAYRLNLDSTSLQANYAKPALAVRASYAFSVPHDSVEPSGCVRGINVYPRATFSVSIPDDSNAPCVRRVEVDHRLAFAPQDQAPGSPLGDEYVAGLFTDSDAPLFYVEVEGVEGCFPVPFWCNIFDLENSRAPVSYAGTFTAGRFDNIHLHHRHEDVGCFGLFGVFPGILCDESVFDDVIVEAPGSFDGTIHMHWRWGKPFGIGFGNGEFVFPDGQDWLFLLADADLALENPKGGITEVIDAHDIFHDIRTKEKVIYVECEQTMACSSFMHRQHETLVTGFAFALGPVSDPACAKLDAFSRELGYCCQRDPGLCRSTPRGWLARWYLLAEIIFGAPPQSSCPPESHPLLKPGRGGTGLCDLVDVSSVPLNTVTPLCISNAVGEVCFSSPGFVVDWNVSRKVVGNALIEQPGFSGSSLVMDFSPPIRSVRHLPVVVDSTSGSQVVTGDVFLGGALIDSLAVVADTSAGLFAEAFLSIDPGQEFDRVVVKVADPEHRFAVGSFRTCLEGIQDGDLDEDGDVDMDDFEVLDACTGGSGVISGAACLDADLDEDGDVDCDDVAVFEVLIPGGLGNLPDQDADGVPDACDNCPTVFNPGQTDCDLNGIGDECELAEGLAADCNGNAIPDDCDINSGVGVDRNNNRVLDECEVDCNGNGAPDDFDVLTRSSADCNLNEVPDECEALSVGISEVSPTAGGFRGGETVFLLGHGFTSKEDMTVQFGELLVEEFMVLDPMTLGVVVPELPLLVHSLTVGNGVTKELRPRTVDVMVTTSDGCATRLRGYTYGSIQRRASVSPR